MSYEGLAILTEPTSSFPTNEPIAISKICEGASTFVMSSCKPISPS